MHEPNSERHSPRYLVFLFVVAAAIGYATACSGGSENGNADGPVECGNTSCTSGEYCIVEECCGTDVGGGSASYQCGEIPNSCSGNVCGCEKVDPCPTEGTGRCRSNRVFVCPAY